MKPSWSEYFLDIAKTVSSKAKCYGRSHGAVIVLNKNIIATGYNGTPSGQFNCKTENGCPRCNHRDYFGPGNRYDLCICEHAEKNAIYQAAKLGHPTQNSVMYIYGSLPCKECTMAILAAGIQRLVTSEDGSDLEIGTTQRFRDILIESQSKVAEEITSNL